MRTGNPQTALQAIAWPRLLVSGWPWRSAGYLLTNLPLAAAAIAGLAVPAVPWLVLAARLGAGSYQVGPIVILVLLGAVLILAFGPLIAVPLAGLEGRRLRMVDVRVVGPGHRTAAAGGPVSWLRARYTEPATWREVGYACLLATVAPALTLAALFAVLLAGILMASLSCHTFSGQGICG
jgi:hypothetical protein